MMKSIFEEVKNSNLCEATKLAVLAHMSGLESRQKENNRSIRKTILQTLMTAEQPVRISDLTHAENCPLDDYTVQRVSAQMKCLVQAGLVERLETPTGKMVEVAPNKSVAEIITTFRKKA